MGNSLKIFFIVIFSNLIMTQTITINDTDFSKGKLGNIQKIKVKDYAKFHGHICDGLIAKIYCFRVGIKTTIS